MSCRIQLKERGLLFVVVISNSGKVMGKSRKNHITRVWDFNEVDIFDIRINI